MEQNYFKIIKWLLIFGIIAIIAILITIPIIDYLEVPSLVNFNIVPTNASIDVDGQTYGIGVSRLAAGKHEAIISADGFQMKAVVFEVKDHQTSDIQEYLLCKDGTMDCYKKNVASLLMLQTFNFDSLNQEFSNFMNSYQNAKNFLLRLPVQEYCDASSSTDEMEDTIIEQLEIEINDGVDDKRCPDDGLCVVVSGVECKEDSVRSILNGYKVDSDFYYILYDENVENAYLVEEK